MPTKQQLQNRLNPNPTNVNIAGQGLFRGVGDDTAIYYRQGDTIKQLDLVGTFMPSNAERAAAGNFGNQIGISQHRLKEKTGIGFQDLPTFNIGDLRQSRGSTGIRLGAIEGNFGGGTLDEFLNLNKAGGTQQQVNTEQNFLNTLSPQDQEAVIQAGMAGGLTREQATKIAQGGGQPITPQTIEDGIKNLPTTLSPSQIDQYYKEEGNKAQPLPPLEWLQRKTDGKKSDIITTDTSKSASPIEIATGTNDTTKADSTFAGAEATNKSIQDYINLLTPPETEDSGNIKDLIDTINTELGDLKGRGQAQLSAEEAQGVEIKKQLLQNAQTELNQKLAEYKAIQAKYQALNADIEGKPITMSSIIGSQAQVNRAMRAELNVKASEIAMIQANVAGAQGNLNLAQDAADRAVDLKYEDAKDAIEIRLQQLELLQDELDKDEQIITNAIELFLNDQDRAIAVQQANEKDQNATILNLMQKYPDAGWTGIPRSVDEATRQIQNSAIYRREVRVVGGVSDGETPKVKEPSSTQRIAAGFAERTAQASRIIDEIGEKFTGFGSRIGAFLPQGLKTEDRQRFEQAQRNFVNAILRRESGAAIAPSEFESASLQYFPQPGDSQAVIEQKRQNRNTSIRALELEAGEAIKQLRGEFPSIQETVTIGGNIYQVGTIIQNSSGQRARVNSDGTLTLI